VDSIVDAKGRVQSLVNTPAVKIDELKEAKKKLEELLVLARKQLKPLPPPKKAKTK
jgi:hypothetical protein